MSRASEAWTQLASARGAEPGWHALRVATTAPVELQVARGEPSGRRALLVTVGSRSVPAGTKYPDCVGFVAEPETVVPGPAGMVRVAVQLKDDSYSALFQALCDDLIDVLEAAGSESAAVRILFGRLGTWQRFAAKFGDAPMSKEARLGLFGELWFLRKCCFDRLAANDAVEMWRGPLREPYDFHHRCLNVEVKTSTGNRSQVVGIASLDQLSTPVGELLLLAHLTATDSPSGETLPEIVDSLREAFRSRDLSALNRFNDLLTEAGYLDAHASEYSNADYLVNEIRWFNVVDGFPRLTRQAVHTAILEASYKLNLDGCRPFEITPEYASALLAEYL